ncbi:hypothetical protein J0S82_001990 [Galemys pyrenaicus]|uniref:Uncharacterized protein n=1 Tax=Galemys pyrenaicus TaxID=202257 RepID=A0A8J6AN08_GALPY|nr:hypothetical protein J0S82_001990 [Galemys pyrenaicus]
MDRCRLQVDTAFHSFWKSTARKHEPVHEFTHQEVPPTPSLLNVTITTGKPLGGSYLDFGTWDIGSSNLVEGLCARLSQTQTRWHLCAAAAEEIPALTMANEKPKEGVKAENYGHINLKVADMQLLQEAAHLQEDAGKLLLLGNTKASEQKGFPGIKIMVTNCSPDDRETSQSR